MVNILFIQPIFAPDQIRADRNINSLRSIKNFIEKNGVDGCNVQVVLGGWARTDDLWNQTVSASREVIGAEYIPLRFPKNFGKAIIVNNLYQSAIKSGVQPNFLFTCDSDILFDDAEKHMFIRLVAAAQHLEKQSGKPFGMISLNQKSGNCHWPVCYENQITYEMALNDNEKFAEKMVWPTNPSGIAGGCLFISRTTWEFLGGYKVFGIYSADDAVLLLEMGRKGFGYYMSDTISIIHPGEDDAEYAAWKHKVCSRDLISGMKSNIDHIIAEADQFWDEKVK